MGRTIAYSESVYLEVERMYGFSLPGDFNTMWKQGWMSLEIPFDPIIFTQPGRNYMWLNDMRKCCRSNFQIIVSHFFLTSSPLRLLARVITGAFRRITTCGFCSALTMTTWERFMHLILNRRYFAKPWKVHMNIPLVSERSSSVGIPISRSSGHNLGKEISEAPLIKIENWGNLDALIKPEECKAIIRQQISFPELDKRVRWMDLAY